MARPLLNLGVAAAIALSCTACGRKGTLETPPPPLAEGQVQPDKAKAANRPFILDPLLR